MVECDGQAGKARLVTTLPLTSRQATDALGRTQGGPAAALADGFTLRPWEIKTLTLHP